MIDYKVGSIKVRRGTEEQRIGTIFDLGEFVYITDKKRLYVGDGSTTGGILVSNKNFIIDSNTEIIPNECVYGDIIYNKRLGKTYIVGLDTTGNLRLVIISDFSLCISLNNTIQELSGRLDALKNCLGVS